MRFLGLVVSQWGLFHLPENTFLKKSVAKAVVQKVPSPERHINTGFFGTSKPKGTTPTRCVILCFLLCHLILSRFHRRFRLKSFNYFVFCDTCYQFVSIYMLT